MGLSVSAQTSQAPDNTKTNQRDKNGANATADQQSHATADRDITQRIRRSLTQDKALSTYAKNIKVITQNGDVTLRGPVRSEDEKKTIEAKAIDVAGASHVKSELQVAPKK
jgi:osmotically-inducible protein OsmY